MNRSLLRYIVCGLAFFFLSDGYTKESRLTGKEIAEKVYHREDGEDFLGRATMTLHSSTGSPRMRQFFLFAREPKSGHLFSLIRFDKPADVKDTGLLTIDQTGQDSDQWIFLPAIKRSRRISSSRKSGSFVNSDFAFEEFQDRSVEKDKHIAKGMAKIDGVEAYVVESLPVDPTNSSYSKRVSWIHPKLWLPLRVDFYESSANAPSKRLMAKKIQKIQDIWTVTEMEMESFHTDTKTSISFSSIRYNSNLPESLFSVRALEDPKADLKYRN